MLCSLPLAIFRPHDLDELAAQATAAGSRTQQQPGDPSRSAAERLEAGPGGAEARMRTAEEARRNTAAGQ